ncbi:FadR/GntR family transcriptional regulator [Lampropedia aestuarii]|uniref:FadR/GntR family transcriptional regulator n=1 Tax=Lampropedia aestuarii TaxID=2562762 RepID=UPI0024690A36|nr:FadR/GntR family transcriptional regulator [Lampropedia aestuarii]MDH5855853.1 FadR/GntR family transcriptional regulator [Lampropedia aestuarii]
MSSTPSELPQPSAPEPLRGRSSRGNSRSLAQQLFDQFSTQIRDGDWIAGEKLPTESELVRRFDVSRTVVREAISKLQTAALVETRHGIGTFVLKAAAPTAALRSPLEWSEPINVLALLELRTSLETEAAGLAASRRSPQQLDAIRRAFDAFNASHSAGLDTAGHDLAFHLAIAAATSNRYFEEVLGHFGVQLIPPTHHDMIHVPERDPEDLPRVRREHEEILLAIERQDPDSAKAAMRLHLNNSRERLRKAQAQYG